MAQKVNKKLTKSNDKVIAGVCAGFAEYADLDPTLVRILYVLISIFSGVITGIIVYIIAWIVMPEPGAKKYMGKAKEASK